MSDRTATVHWLPASNEADGAALKTGALEKLLVAGPRAEKQAAARRRASAEEGFGGECQVTVTIVNVHLDPRRWSRLHPAAGATSSPSARSCTSGRRRASMRTHEAAACRARTCRCGYPLVYFDDARLPLAGVCALEVDVVNLLRLRESSSVNVAFSMTCGPATTEVVLPRAMRRHHLTMFSAIAAPLNTAATMAHSPSKGVAAAEGVASKACPERAHATRPVEGTRICSLSPGSRSQASAPASFWPACGPHPRARGFRASARAGLGAGSRVSACRSPPDKSSKSCHRACKCQCGCPPHARRS